MKELEVKSLYTLTETLAAPLLSRVTYPWEALPEIGAFILELGASLSEEEYEKQGENIWIARSAKVAPTASITGPAIIGKNAEIRHCAFIRGNALVGSITSNVKSDKLLVKVHTQEGDIETGIKKFGAMIGDEVEVGCGSVLNPGTVIGRNSNIYPLSSVRGVVASDSIYKKQGEVAQKR